MSYAERPRNEAAETKGTGSPRRHARSWAPAFALLVVTAMTIWSAPRVSAAAAAWMAAAPVRGAELTVSLTPVVSTPGQALDAAKGRTGVDGSTGELQPGWRFNAVGAVCDGPASVDEWPVVEVRTASGGVWTEWRLLEFWQAPAAECGVAARVVADPLWVGAAEQLEYRAVAAPAGGQLRFSFINSLGDADLTDRLAAGLRRAAAAVASIDPITAAEAAAARPPIVTRAQWGADESWRSGVPDYASVRMAFVHHTAGGNSYTREQAPAVVRAVYHYHTHACGFRDIGYNFLVDRYGTIYEGRYGGITKGPVGAQTLGFNTGSTGISLMGEFSAVPPPAKALASLEYLLAWKLDIHHIDPLSKVAMVCGASDRYTAGQTVRLPAISAHRDACYTACPGDALYAHMAKVRSVVADRGLPKIYGYVVSPTALSPDGDGQGESLTVEYVVSEPAEWKVEVLGASGQSMRSFAGSGDFASVEWDGRDEDGAPVPDGWYTVSGSAVAASGGATPGTETVVVDTAVPTFTGFVVRSPVVNPDGNGAGDRVGLSYALSEPCSVQVSVRSASGQTVRRLLLWSEPTEGPRSVVWDGRVLSAGKLVAAAEGLYTLFAEARDAAGNVCTQSGQVKVDRSIRMQSMQPQYCSPNADGVKDMAAIQFVLRRTANVAVELVAGHKVVRTTSLGRLAAGAHAFEWDGKTTDGRRVTGGTYQLVLTASGGSVNARAACSVIADYAGPRLRTGPSAVGRRARTAGTWYAVRDLRSSVARVVAVVRRSGKLVRRIDCGWVTTNGTHRIAFKPAKAGLYVVSFSAVDQAGNRQVTRAFWRLRVR